VSIIETRHPRELFSYFEEDGNSVVEERSPGVYGISGYPVVLQVIESKKLPVSENLWLRGLNDDLNAEAAGTILEESRKRKRKAEFGAYIYALLSANKETIREVIRMADGILPFNELMEELGLAAEWEKRGEAKGVAIGEAKGVAIGEAKGEKNGWEKAIGLLKRGYTLEQLERMNPGDLASPAS
jgi:hypothetical protein